MKLPIIMIIITIIITHKMTYQIISVIFSIITHESKPHQPPRLPTRQILPSWRTLWIFERHGWAPLSPKKPDLPRQVTMLYYVKSCVSIFSLYHHWIIYSIITSWIKLDLLSIIAFTIIIMVLSLSLSFITIFISILSPHIPLRMAFDLMLVKLRICLISIKHIVLHNGITMGTSEWRKDSPF